MRLERKKNTINNAVWGVINRSILLLGPFMVRTMLLYILGVEYLGLSSLFSSILEVLNMAELGFGSAVAYCMYSAIANENKEEICALLNVFKKVYKIVGTAIMSIGLMMMPFLAYLIHGHVPDEINIYYLYLLYLCNSVISYLMFSYRAVLFSAFQREDVMSRVHSITLIIQYCFQIFVLFYFRDYYAYYIIVPLVSVMKNLLVLKMSKQIYPEFYPCGDLSFETKEKIKEKIKGIIISKFCGVTRNTFDSIILSMFIGLSTVAIYSNYYYILCNVSAMIVVLINSMRAGVGNSVAIETVEKNYKDFRKFSFMYMIISSWVCVCLLCLYQPFMKIWAHEENMFPLYMAILFAGYYFALSMGDIIDLYSGAAGLWWENRKRCLGEAIGNIILNFFFGYMWGELGVVIATIITILFFNFWWKLKILYDNYFKGYDSQEYIRNYIKYIFVLILCGFVVFEICSLINISELSNFVVRLLICALLPWLLLYVFYRKTILFDESMIFVKGIIGSNRGKY